MAECVPASIVVGGTISASAYAELADIISLERLSIEWDGESFQPSHRTDGEPLRLYANDVPMGRLDHLEAWCVENRLSFARWCGGYGSQWGPERVVFTGDGEPQSYAADELDWVVIGRATAINLGSMEAIIAHFDAAEVEIPPLAGC